MLLTFEPSITAELESVVRGYERTNTALVAQKGTDLSLAGHGTSDLGLHWIVPKITEYMGCNTQEALSYLFIGLTVLSLLLILFGVIFFFKGMFHKLIYLFTSGGLLSFFVFINDDPRQVAIFWISSTFPLFLWILRSRKNVLPIVLFIPLSLLGCFCFYVSWVYGGGFYLLALFLCLFSEQRMAPKIACLLILLGPLYYFRTLKNDQIAQAITKIQQIEKVGEKPESALPHWHSLLKGLGQYENDYRIPKSDQQLYNFVVTRGGAYEFMSDEYLSFVKSFYWKFLDEDSSFVFKTYFKKAMHLVSIIMAARLSQNMFMRGFLITFFIWGMIILVKYFVVQKEYRMTLPFILLFLLLSAWPILSVISTTTATPMVAFMYCYFLTLGIWDWERVSGDHFPFY